MKTILLLNVLFTLISCTGFPVNESSSLFGNWIEVKRYIPWMSEVERTFKSTVTVSKRQEEAFIDIEIVGHHVCGLNGYIKLSKDRIMFNSSDKKNSELDSNFDKDKPCKMLFKREENQLKVISESSGCRAACGDKESFTGHVFLWSLR